MEQQASANNQDDEEESSRYPNHRQHQEEVENADEGSSHPANGFAGVAGRTRGRLEQLLNEELQNASSSNNNNNEDNMNQELQSFLRFLEASLGPRVEIDNVRARHMLEACAGNVDMAAALYLEDVIADAASNNRRRDDEDDQQQRHNHQRRINKLARVRAARRSAMEDRAAAAAAANDDVEGEELAEPDVPPPDPEVPLDFLGAVGRPADENNVDEIIIQRQRELANVSDDEAGSPPRQNNLSSTRRGSRRASKIPANKRSRKEWDDLSSDSDSNEEDVLLDKFYAAKDPLNLLWGNDPQDSSARIPFHWREAGFGWSPSKIGLVSTMTYEHESVTAPGVPRRSFSVQVTHYCGGVTALLSIVTALLQCGVAVEGKKLSSSGKLSTRFYDLTFPKASRECEHRLADAISSLLWIAAESVHSDTSTNASRRHVTRNRQLCRVCTWKTSEDDTNNNDSRVCEEVQTSWTNRNDLRSYVISSMPLFVGPGGCALLLETILRIHGVKRLERMLKKAGSGARPLIRCWCSNGCMAAKREAEKNSSSQKSIFCGTAECMSVELLSLILTGTIHKDYRTWSTGELGFGLLSCTKDEPEIGPALKNPLKPVWIIRGESFFSSMWLKNEDQQQYLDSHGATLVMVHWLCANKGRESSFSVVTARKDQQVSIGGQHQSYEEQKQVVVFHADDRANYPNHYKRWRFAFFPDDGSNCKTILSSSDFRQWKPYFRLDKHEKDHVDCLYAPRIYLAIWSRWPNADVVLLNNCTAVPIFLQNE